MVFFKSWQLWEQLTFVLIASLVLVFIAGFIKLLWTNRRAKKHELNDEENRVRIQEMRDSGQILQNPEEIDIPFGVRALERDVEVPGIWHAKETVSILESQRIGHYVKRKSDSEASLSNDRPSTAKSAISMIKGGRRAFSNLTFTSSHSEVAPISDPQYGDPGTQSGDAASSRHTYKPKRSSQLRFSSYNDSQYDPNTLGKLEGSIPMKDGVQVRRPFGAGPLPGTGENLSSNSLAENADNERTSGSSESTDWTFARRIPPEHASASQSPSLYSSAQVHQYGVYFPVTPGGSASNPFATPDQTPQGSDSSSTSRHARETYGIVAESSARESGLPLLQSSSRQASPERRSVTFEGGFQHANTTTRHVNSGFSVHPAGTFSKTAEAKGKEVERPTTRDSQMSQSSEKRKSNKLQKKARQSLTGPRRSTDLR